MILGRRLILLAQRQMVWLQTMLFLLFSFVIFTSSASAVIRFTNRSLYINSAVPGATTDYTVSFTYTTQTSIGSLDMLFCYDPIPSEPITAQNPTDHHACVVPAGLDVSHATLASQSGETGYTISLQTANHIVLSRNPGVVGNTPSVYKFTGVINPTDTSQSFAIRLSDYTSNNASGPVVDLGSILSQVTDGILLETQVPPMLIFCLAQQVSTDCTSASGGNYSDLGTLNPTNTLATSSQMAVGTNASGGFVVTVNGTTMAAGNHVINALVQPTLSAPGNSQFGINLRANTQPAVGSDPDGDSSNAAPMASYDTPNLYMYKDGDVVASAPNVSLVRRFTVSYVVNSPPDLRAGVYTTTLTYICSGRF